MYVDTKQVCFIGPQGKTQSLNPSRGSILLFYIKPQINYYSEHTKLRTGFAENLTTSVYR